MKGHRQTLLWQDHKPCASQPTQRCTIHPLLLWLSLIAGRQLLLLLLDMLLLLPPLLLYQTKNSGPACALSSSPASRPRRSPSSALKAPTLLVS